MKKPFLNPIFLSALIHGLFGLTLVSIAYARNSPTVEIYDEPSEKVTEVPMALPVSIPPTSGDLDELSEVKSGPVPTPTPSAIKVCQELLAYHKRLDAEHKKKKHHKRKQP